MNEKNLFNSSELLLMGFKLVKDGGFTYYSLDPNPKSIDQVALCTNDMIKAVKSPVYHVFQTNDLKNQQRLTKSDIESFKVAYGI